MAFEDNRAPRWRCLSILILAAAVFLPQTAVAAEMTDDRFIESLGDETNRSPVDRKRLARVFFSLAATLDGGKSSVQLLQSKVSVPETSWQAVRSLLRTRYANYLTSLEAMRESVSELLDEPESMLLLHRVLTDAQRTCWYLDLHDRLIETYGTDTADLMTTLSSREACNKVRTIAFQPRVEAMIRDALVEQVYQRRQILELEAELKETEQFLKDMLDSEAPD